MDLNEILGYLASSLIGLVLGLIGAGGFMIMPVLIYLFQIPLKSAVPVSLLAVGTGSLIASFNHYKNKNIDLKTALTFIILSSLGAVSGGLVSHLISDKFKMSIFIVLMLIGALSLLRKKPENHKELKKNQNIILIILMAFIIGFWAGLIGISGGFMIVPALITLLNYPVKKAIGTSLIIIFINSLSGFLGNINFTSSINWRFVILLIISTSLGGFIGSYLNKNIQSPNLQKSLGYFLFVLSFFMIFKEFIFNLI